MEHPKVIQLALGPMANFVYLVIDETAKVAAVVDPGWHAVAIEETAKKEGVNITHLLLTHSHFDHTNAVLALQKRTGAILCIHEKEAGDVEGEYSRVIKIGDGDVIRSGSLEFKVMHTPGHTKGSVCYLVDDCCFTGDTLFVNGIGRTDLAGGDAEEMFASINRLKRLPDKTIVYPGHNYGGSPTSTIGEQKKTNPYMRYGISDFLRMA